jgi:preprotein translocase subunit SecB
MPKTQLSHSPLEILQHEFIEIAVRSTLPCDEGNFGAGMLEVEREQTRKTDDENIWMLILRIAFQQGETDENPPPYEGHLTIRGVFRVHEQYNHDADRLIRITGASILYGAAREMLANLTARSANGMISLPSVSFMEASTKGQKEARGKKSPKKLK